jgi:5'-deoxynucleotidase YfbR-like HD superfamily hydrolase
MSYNKQLSKINNLINDSDLSSMDSIKRWTLLQTNKNENLSEHSFWVSFYCLYILENFFYGYDSQFKFEVLTYSLMHDVEEVFSGDIPHQVKNDEVNGSEMRTLLSKFCGSRLDDKLKEHDLYSVQHMVQNVTPLIKTIVKLSDWMSFNKFINNEISLGNKSDKLLKTQIYCINNLESEFKLMLDLRDI